MARTLASNTAVGRDELVAFVRPRHRFVLLTRRRDGSAQASPVTGGVDASGRMVISTCPDRAKTTNLRRDPRASVVVLSDDWNGPWVQIDADAEVVGMPDALD